MMKKTVLVLGLTAMFGMTLSVTSCKNTKKDKTEKSATEMDPAKVTDPKTEAQMKTEQQKMEQAKSEAQRTKKEEVEGKMSKDGEKASNAQEKIDNAVSAIEKSGADFVKAIKNSENKATVTAAQTKFIQSVKDAQSVYKKVAANADANVDLNKASQAIQAASTEAQKAAKEAMSQR